MKPSTKKVGIYLLLLIVPFAILAAIYPFLPAEISTGRHLFSGSTAPKWVIFILGFIPILVYWKRARR